MESEWYYAKDKKKVGPLTTAQLKELVRNGELLATHQIWKDGMDKWAEARTVPGLFTQNAPAGKRLLHKMSDLAEKVGTAASEAVAGKEGEPSLDKQPAVFLRPEFFGGRTRIGISHGQLDGLGAKVAAALFGWTYLFWMLNNTRSAWQFVPFSRTEYVRISLSQRLRWEKVFPILVTWSVCIFTVIAACIVVAVVLKEYGLLLVVIGLPAGYLLANLFAYQMVMRLRADELHRSVILLEYGFPAKHQLLFGISHAPVEEQMNGVLQLCEAISRAEFSPWEQFTAHGSGDGLMTGMVRKVARLMPGSRG